MDHPATPDDPREHTPAELARRAGGAALVTIHGRPLPVEAHPWLALMAGYTSDASRATIARSLEAAAAVLTQGAAGARSFPWWWLRRTHVLALRGALVARGLAPATSNRVLVAVRGVLRESFLAEMMTAEDYARAREVGRVEGSREPRGRAVARAELDRMRATCDPATVAGARDRALLAVLEQTGLRRREATTLDLSSYDAATGVVRVVGKGNRERAVHANARLRADLAAWLAARGAAPGPLFHPFAPRTGAVQRGRRLSYSGMQRVVQRVADAAGVAHLSMHDFRRTLIGDLLDEGTDIATVARIVGHASVETTALYDRRGPDARAAALERHGRAIERTEEHEDE